MKNLMASIAAAIVLTFALTACGSTSSYEYDDDDYSYGVEDCDAEDMLEGDSDCYGSSNGHSTKKHSTKKHKSTKPKISKPKTYKPRTTYKPRLSTRRK